MTEPPIDLKRLLDSLPGDGEGPRFMAPWQARIFALVVALAEEGRFPWPEFQRRLIDEVGHGDGDPAHYYECWLAAAERLVRELALLPADAIEARAAELRAAARR